MAITECADKQRPMSKHELAARRWVDAHEANERLAIEASQASERSVQANQAEHEAWLALKEAAGRGDAPPCNPISPPQYAQSNFGR